MESAMVNFFIFALLELIAAVILLPVLLAIYKGILGR